MLRKDVKLGFAIGGVMLAVVVVYVLVVPNNDRKTPLVVEEGQANGTSVNTGTPAKDVSVATDQKPGDTKPIDITAADTGEVKPDNVGDTKSSVAISGSNQPTTAPSVATKGDVWDLALRDGVIPPSMSSTPTGNTPSGNTSAGNDAAGPSDQKSSDVPADKSAERQSSVQTSMLGNQPDAAIADAGAGDATNDVNAKPSDAKLAGDIELRGGSAHDSTHIVKAGETLSSIAAAAYGDSKSWKLIAAANPTVNPNRLSAGTKLTVPAASGIVPHGSTVGSRIDSKSQYQVQASDSLYRISMRLYGTGDHATKLYEDNKDVIGANPARLKLGMILKLSDPPSVATARAS